MTPLELAQMRELDGWLLNNKITKEEKDQLRETLNDLDDLAKRMREKRV